MAVCRHRYRRPGSALLLAMGAMVALLLLVGGGFYYFNAAKNNTKEVVLTATAARGPFENIVLEQGEVESSKNVEVMCEVKARNSTGTAVLWVIPEGTQVAKGDKLVELDASALDLELKTQRVLVNTNLAAKIASQSTLDQAIVAKSEYLEGTYTQEEKLIQSQILIAEEALSRSQETAKYSERLAALGFQTALQLKADQFAVEQSRVELELAKSKLRTLQEITKKKMLIQLDAAIDTARAKLSSDTSSLAEEEKKLHEIEEQIAKCVIYAPEVGVVVHANKMSQRGNAEFVLEPGSTVRERQVLIRLPDASKMQIKANINEARVPLVKEDMPVAIRIGAFEDLPMRGIVTKVNKYAEPTSWFSSQVKEYATYVQIIDPPPGVRSGMTAEVRVFVDQRPSELQIPVQSLYEYRGHVFCLVKKTKSYETRELTLGASNDKFAVINDGIEEGEEVVLNPRGHREKLQLPDLPEVEEETKPAVGELATNDSPAADSTATQDATAAQPTNATANEDSDANKDADATKTETTTTNTTTAGGGGE